MKILLPSVILFLFCITISFAQAPKGINYQGAARDNEGKPYASKTISVRISILKNSATGEVEYSETHKPQTNQFGLFTLVIGQGTKLTGDFAFISWAIGNKWLQIEMDPNGGSSFTLAGTQQLMTVPYAFYAEYAGNSNGLTAGSGIAITNDVITNTGDADGDPTNELQNLAEVLTKSNNAGGLKITNLGAPVVASDAATKNYVDTQTALDLDKDPTNELQTLAQVLGRGNNAGGLKLTNLGAPAVNSDATTKQYVDNAIATNYAFKVPYTFTNTGSSVTNQVVAFGTDIYDDFSVTGANRFVAASAGYYMFFIDGTVNGSNIANIILSVRVNNVDVYQAKKSEERIASIIYTNHHLNLMVKLNQGDFVELVITSNTSGDNVSGVLFGYKL